MNNPWADAASAPQEKPSWLTEEIETALRAKGFPLDNDGMLMLQQDAKKWLDFYKDKEMEYRKICAGFLVANHQANEGMNNIDLGGGYQAKVGIKFNYKLDSDNDKVWATLEKIEKIGNEGKFIADRLVSWTPNFLLTEYRTLQEDAEKGSQISKQILDTVNEMLTITEAAPTLEIKEKKKK